MEELDAERVSLSGDFSVDVAELTRRKRDRNAILSWNFDSTKMGGFKTEEWANLIGAVLD